MRWVVAGEGLEDFLRVGFHPERAAVDRHQDRPVLGAWPKRMRSKVA
jgi:hypothetical protein